VGREVTVKETVADSIAEIAWYIESKGLVATAEKFADEVYDFFIKLSDSRRVHAICRDPGGPCSVINAFHTKRNIQ
jgi:hypothetical protein